MNDLHVNATADLEVAVPRGDDGTLQDGIVTLLNRIDRVADTEVEEISAVSPTQNAVHVATSVHIRVRLPDAVADEPAVVRDTLADQLGVQTVTAVETT